MRLSGYALWFLLKTAIPELPDQSIKKYVAMLDHKYHGSGEDAYFACLHGIARLEDFTKGARPLEGRIRQVFRALRDAGYRNQTVTQDQCFGMVQIVNGEVYCKPGRYKTPQDEIPKDNRSKEIKSIVGQCIWRGDSLERCMAYVPVLREDGTVKINQKDFDETVPKIYQRISERREKNRKQNNSLLDDLVENKENIVINENDPALRLRIYTEKAIAAVKTHNEPPVVFMMVNTFRRVLFDEHNRPLIESMNDYAVRGIIPNDVLNLRRSN